MEVNIENLKSQTTEALKALLDYSRAHETHFKLAHNRVSTFTIPFGRYSSIEDSEDQYNSSLVMYNNYSEIVRTLEDELGNRLESIFIF